MYGADEEVILVLVANLSRVRDPEEVQRTIRRSHAMLVGRRHSFDGLNCESGSRRPRGRKELGKLHETLLSHHGWSANASPHVHPMKTMARPTPKGKCGDNRLPTVADA
jgi:hypothetical protein